MKSPFNNHQHLNPCPETSMLSSGKQKRNIFHFLPLPSLVTVLFCACVMLVGLFCSHVTLPAYHDPLPPPSSITKHYSRCKPPIYSQEISLHMDTKGLQKSFPHQASTILASKRICFDQGHLHKNCTTSTLSQILPPSLHWAALYTSTEDASPFPKANICQPPCNSHPLVPTEIVTDIH